MSMNQVMIQRRVLFSPEYAYSCGAPRYPQSAEFGNTVQYGDRRMLYPSQSRSCLFMIIRIRFIARKRMRIGIFH